MKNLETKTKRMSLANIEGRLSVTEMETIMAGSGRGCFIMGGLLCLSALGGPAIFFATAVTATMYCA
jgi:hypothetical protein